MARGIAPEYACIDVRTNKIVPPDPVELDVEIDMASLQESGSVNWKKVEDALFLIASEYVQTFSTFHRDKSFYGFAFDCNADYGQVYVCANTPNALTAAATRYKKESPDLYDQQSIDDLEKDLRWSVGDWEFQAFTTGGFSDAWHPIEELLVDAIPWGSEDPWDGEIDHQAVQEYHDSFMDTACRSMMRLESQGVMGSLTRTDDFKTFVIDHDESEEDAWNRLEAAWRMKSDA